jgi:shikimate dehydrogenase
MRLGVAGWPVAHSRSPQMHNAALAAVGLGSWRYQLLPIAPELLEETLPALPAAGFRGVNVTIPHKRRALAIVLEAGGRASDRARAIGAANTIVFPEDHGGVVGPLADNTDAPSLQRAIGERSRDATALVLGAGGSARAAIWALLDAGAAEVRVWSRRPSQAAALAEELGIVHAASPGPAEILVNCTPLGMGPADPAPVEQLRGFSAVVDFVYRRGETELVRRARRQGLFIVDGLELLLGQGALSFEQFTGRPAPLAQMRATLVRP